MNKTQLALPFGTLEELIAFYYAHFTPADIPVPLKL